jgi:hypothetical protein
MLRRRADAPPDDALRCAILPGYAAQFHSADDSFRATADEMLRRRVSGCPANWPCHHMPETQVLTSTSIDVDSVVVRAAR